MSLNLKVLKSALIGCFLLGSSTVLLPAIATKPIAPVQQAFDSQTIAKQVLRLAIARKEVDATAKITQIARVKQEIWMYNPVPYWKITIADQRRSLQYFTNESGSFMVLMRRNGKLINPPEKPIDDGMVDAAIRQAKEWGYSGPATVSREPMRWAIGCENVSAPYACDPVPREGWKITLSHPQSDSLRWVLRGETAEELQIIERSNLELERRLPIQVRDEIKRVASKHLQLSPALVLMTQIDLQTFSNSCLDLNRSAEGCTRGIVKGYRVTVAGKSNEQQVYRISNDAKTVRTEAIAGLPFRTDELPTVVARKLFNVAQSDLKSAIANLSIRRVEETFVCDRHPTAPPDAPCLPFKRINGWKVTMTNNQNQKSMTYRVGLGGSILSRQ